MAGQIFLGGPGFVERMQALVELDPAAEKDIPRQQRRAPVKPIEYYVKQSDGRDAGICEAVNDGQHSMTDIANALGLSISRVSRIVGKAMSEAKGKA